MLQWVVTLTPDIFSGISASSEAVVWVILDPISAGPSLLLSSNHPSGPQRRNVDFSDFLSSACCSCLTRRWCTALAKRHSFSLTRFLKVAIELFKSFDSYGRQSSSDKISLREDGGIRKTQRLKALDVESTVWPEKWGSIAVYYNSTVQREVNAVPSIFCFLSTDFGQYLFDFLPPYLSFLRSFSPLSLLNVFFLFDQYIIDSYHRCLPCLYMDHLLICLSANSSTNSPDLWEQMRSHQSKWFLWFHWAYSTKYSVHFIQVTFSDAGLWLQCPQLSQPNLQLSAFSALFQSSTTHHQEKEQHYKKAIWDTLGRHRVLSDKGRKDVQGVSFEQHPSSWGHRQLEHKQRKKSFTSDTHKTLLDAQVSPTPPSPPPITVAQVSWQPYGRVDSSCLSLQGLRTDDRGKPMKCYL